MKLPWRLQMNYHKQQKIDKTYTYYNESRYYDNQIKVFTDLESSFQKYRISKVMQIYTPNREERVLDLGCGWGTFCFAVAPICNEVMGLDFSKKSIDLCNKLLKKSQYTNIKFVCADAQDTGLESETYDVVICADLFEHLYPETFEKVLDECKRLLKKRGKLLIWTPYRGHILEILKNNNIILKKDITHIDYKSMDCLLNALSKRHFLIRKSYYTESHIPIFRNLERLFLGSLPLMRRRIAILAEKQINP